MSTVPHGWPDGEARPMPFGPVLASGNSITVGGSGVLDLGVLELAAWPCVAIAIEAGVEVQVDIDWNYVGDAVIQPHQTLYHDGLQSVRTIACLGQRAVGFTITTDPGRTLTYAVMGTNRPADSANGIGVMRSIVLPDPGAGIATVPLYEVPLGTTAILHGVDCLVSWGAASNLGPMFVEYFDVNGRQVTIAEFDAASAVVGETTRMTANSHQGGTSANLAVAGLTETSWTASRVLPVYRMPYLYTAQLTLNGIVSDDEISALTIVVEEIA